MQLVAALTQSASGQVPLFAGAQLLTGATDASRQQFLTAWQNYTDGQRQMDQLSQAELRLQWDQVRADAAVQELDAALEAQTGPSAGAGPIMRLIQLLDDATQRDTLLTALLDNAVGEAQTLATADRALAIERRNHALEAGHSVTAATHHPAETTIAAPAMSTSTIRLSKRGLAATR